MNMRKRESSFRQLKTEDSNLSDDSRALRGAGVDVLCINSAEIS